MSTEKKAQSRAQRDENRRREEQKDRRAMTLYTVIGVVVVVAAVVLMFWNSGVLQRNLTAVNINGTKYTPADLQYYYTSLYSRHANRYDFLPTASVKDQVYDQETGQSWHDYLLDQAVEQLANNTALAARASSEGYALSQEAQTDLDATLAQLNSSWISGYASRDAFIRANFGSHMTYDRLVTLLNLEFLASDYADSRLAAITHPDTDYEGYYQDNAGSLDTYAYTLLTFQASVPTTDGQGNPVTMTDGEKAAALEEQKTAKKALAEEVKAKLEGGADPEALAESYADDLYSSDLSRRASGSSISTSAYAEWLMDSSRRAGDVTLAEWESSDSCYYYVALFHDRFRDEEPTHSVRHILVRAGTGTGTPTQEEYDEAEEKAQSLLDQWESGEATEDSFATLASTESADSGSAANGGLIANITPASSYVEPFKNWATDSARKAGDAELVKSDYGWHIMYYVSTDDPVWRQTAGSALQDQDYEALTGEVTQGWEISRGAGISFIGV